MIACMISIGILPKNILIAICQKNAISQIIACIIYNKCQKLYESALDSHTPIISLIDALQDNVY